MEISSGQPVLTEILTLEEFDMHRRMCLYMKEWRDLKWLSEFEWCPEASPILGRQTWTHPSWASCNRCVSELRTWTWRRKWRKHGEVFIIWCGPVASSHLPAISTNYQLVGILTQSPTQNIIWMFDRPCQGCKVTSVSVRGTQAFDKFLKYLEILHYGTMDLRWGLKIVKMTLPVSNFESSNHPAIGGRLKILRKCELNHRWVSNQK